ncbi:hypothetical protein TSUD_147140 [Trifolium subterraneum]|uniref:Uncharacterized protein n=1 Tax=Trifolium subterraneum TaxID=3900 RepID=A0A2Z6MV08_TRISU|nr:hypothetical protein TSUD_147140 [Trifolium subterraneum]
MCQNGFGSFPAATLYSNVTKLLDLKERDVLNLSRRFMALHSAAQHCVNKHSPKQNRTMNNLSTVTRPPPKP